MMKIYYDPSRFPFALEGLTPLNVIYPNAFWEKVDGSWPTFMPEESRIRSVSRKAGTLGLDVCLDIEHLSIKDSYDSPPDLATNNIDLTCIKLSEIARIMHHEVPGLNLGYFGLMPYSSWNYALTPIPTRAGQKWIEWNYKQRVIAAQVDTIYLCAYIKYESYSLWAQYFDRIYQAGLFYGLPMRVFIRPRYFDNDELIEEGLWNKMLSLLARYNLPLVLWQMFKFKTEFTGEETWYRTLLKYTTKVR